MYKIFISGTFYNILFKIFSTIVLFFVTPLFITKMGREVYGIWILNFTIIGYFAIVVNGLPGGIIKFISENKYDDKILSKIISISFITYLVVGIFLGIFIFNFSEFISSISDSVLQGLLKFKQLNIIRSIQTLANSFVILLGLYLETDIGVILFLSYSTTCACSLFMFYYVKKFIVNLKLSHKLFDKKLFKEILFFSLALVALEISALLAYQSDELIIGYFLNVGDIPYYFVTTALFMNLRVIYGMLTGLILPVVFEAKKNLNYNLIKTLINKGIRYINILFVSVVLLVSIISEPFIFLWMGEEYSQYALWASLLVLQFVFTAPYVSFLSRILLGYSKVKFLFKINLLFNIFKILVCVYMVFEFGIIGVFASSLITSTLFLIFMFPLLTSKLKISIKEILRDNYKIHFLQMIILVIGFVVINLVKISWLNLFLFCSLYLIIVFSIQYKFFFLEKEKKLVNEFIKKSIFVKWN